MFAELFSIVAPVYLCAALGAIWIRMGRRFDTDLISDLIMTIGAPCLVFSSLVSLEVDSLDKVDLPLRATVIQLDGPLYRNRRVATIVGSAGEWIELIERT